MSEDAYEYRGFKHNYPKVDDGFYLVKNGITYKVDLPMDKTRFTKRINILTGEVYYPSNADKIRAMSDEELAMFLQDIWYISGSNDTTHEWWLNWLKQEVINDGLSEADTETSGEG